jgi:general L-amino acid transport system permease protein
MTDIFATPGFIRDTEAPVLPPPARAAGPAAWLRANLFSSVPNTIATLAALAFIFWTVPPLVNWLLINAVFDAPNRDACVAADGAEGACWAFVKAKLGQFVYGRYPVDERWRIDLVFVLFAVGLIPLAIPGIPYKAQTSLYLFAVFPLAALILLTGGNFSFSPNAVAVFLGILAAASLNAVWKDVQGPSNLVRAATWILVVGAALFVLAAIAALLLPSGTLRINFTGILRGLSLGSLLLGAAACAALILTVVEGIRGILAGRLTALLFTVPIGLIGAYLVLTADTGLPPVETALWGGLMLTLVIAVVGITASLPLGILLALGRRSSLPVIRVTSIVFIEFWRGVPLITVLFMASVMLPLFLPAGMNFDKLMRALIGVSLFSAAYLAEVIRGGLQAIPRGQYEAAGAMGLSFWPATRLIILPQALKIVIPGIVNSFISLFKDTSLVLIIGLFDLLGIIQQNFADPNWISSVTPATGFAFAALVYWVFCFSMSRYSMFMERRLDRSHR